MTFKEFKEKVYKRLSEYRQQELRIHAMGYWRGKAYGHILPKEKAKENILKKYNKAFWASKFRDFNRHSYFKHLNSSQAMCINFFYPLFYEHKLETVLDYMGFANEIVDYKNVFFEKESDIDRFKNQIPTNFDFYFETKTEKRFFFEIKYT